MKSGDRFRKDARHRTTDTKTAEGNNTRKKGRKNKTAESFK